MEEILVLGASQEGVCQFFDWYAGKWQLAGQDRFVLVHGDKMYRGVVADPQGDRLRGMRPDVVVLLAGWSEIRGIFLELHLLQACGARIVVSDGFEENPQ